jgi:hypothetical protein
MRARTFVASAALVAAFGCSSTPASFVKDTDAGARDIPAAPTDKGAVLDVTAPDTQWSRDVPPIDIPPRDAPVDASCTPISTVPYQDRTTNDEFTDPPTCAGCPGAFMRVDALDGGMLSPNATSLTVAGSSAGAQRCTWYVSGGDCGITYGSAATDPDGTGQFQATVPVFCGTNVVRIVCANSAGSRVLVRRLEGTRCEGRDLRVTLSWDDRGTDMELHLVRPGGHINNPAEDCTWFTCMSPNGLEWGDPASTADNPRKDIDNTSNFGPENIFLDRAALGTYTVVVEYWGGGTPSVNDVDIAVRERTVARLRHTMLPQHNVWVVGTVTYPGGTFTPLDRTIDCATPWRTMGSMGCPLPIP